MYPLYGETGNITDKKRIESNEQSSNDQPRWREPPTIYHRRILSFLLHQLRPTDQTLTKRLLSTVSSRIDDRLRRTGLVEQLLMLHLIENTKQTLPVCFHLDILGDSHMLVTILPLALSGLRLVGLHLLPLWSAMFCTADADYLTILVGCDQYPVVVVLKTSQEAIWAVLSVFLFPYEYKSNFLITSIGVT